MTFPLVISVRFKLIGFPKMSIQYEENRVTQGVYIDKGVSQSLARTVLDA